MTPFFSAPDGPDVHAFWDRLRADIERLRADAAELPALGDEGGGGKEWTTLLGALEDLDARVHHLDAYLGCMGAADAHDPLIGHHIAALAPVRAALDKLFVAVGAHLRELPDEAFQRLLEHELVQPVGYFIGRLRARAQEAMDEALEELAADLSVTGLSAWGRLYDRIAGTLRFELAVPGRPAEVLPVSMARSLTQDPDPAVREAAFTGEGRAWEGVAESVAACLNAIAGTRLTLYQRRGIRDFLAPALFDAGIARATLDTMLSAVRARQEVARRYLRRKAGLLGRARLGYQDRMAPLPLAEGARIPWDDARDRLLTAFGHGYPDLRDFAARAFERRWIDHAPRVGKRPGGFCSSSPVIGESRIFMTYAGAMGDLETLAHELGHAFHSSVMGDLRPWARRYPMTLAETASTFAEQLVTDASLGDPCADPSDRAAVLDSRLQKATVFLLDIPMRFDFECALYRERADGEASVSRLQHLVLDAQRQNYGDALAEDELAPWFWASKLHFYITDLSFYNFPYTFGYLFSLGIFARVKAEGPSALADYERLLRATGSADAERVARDGLGVDLQSEDFWHSSIDLIEADLDRFEAVLDELDQ
ncbi:M3 family oligoendopeptidase [Haliangium sp.]|uniref:M3 family oligoendopeptidase n=1 Tax=Haliangium sp. TaxID=2663208 RepID=UPI003D10E2EF